MFSRGRCTLPRADTPPGSTPWADIPRPPPPSIQLVQRTVRILLECILVFVLLHLGTIGRYRVSLVTIPLLEFVMIHSIQWKSFRRNLTLSVLFTLGFVCWSSSFHIVLHFDEPPLQFLSSIYFHVQADFREKIGQIINWCPVAVGLAPPSGKSWIRPCVHLCQS